jgi:CCT motif
VQFYTSGLGLLVHTAGNSALPLVSMMSDDTLCITAYSDVIPTITADEAHTVSRAECLERYREKKLRRLDVNTIRYMKRKINADRRPRESGSHDQQSVPLTDRWTDSRIMQHVTATWSQAAKRLFSFCSEGPARAGQRNG